MALKEPLPLYHSWPLWEQQRRFDLGWVHDQALALPEEEAVVPDGSAARIGVWRCDLATGGLDWSPEVHRLFGIEDDRAPLRARALAAYDDGSRSAMERLRAHALRHHRGFTLDVALRVDGAGERWVRINAAPRIVQGRAVQLFGTKQEVGGVAR